MYDEMTTSDLLVEAHRQSHPKDQPSAEHSVLIDELSTRLRRLDIWRSQVTAEINPYLKDDDGSDLLSEHLRIRYMLQRLSASAALVEPVADEPAAGEAGELASLIREAVRAWVAWEEGAVMLNNMTEVQLTRVADLLSQRHPAPVPVAVPEGREPASAVSEPSEEELDAMERQCYLATEVGNDSGCEYVFEHRRYARAVLARWGHHPAHSQAPLDGKDLQRIQRICAIVLGHEFGNSELDSLALELGHHPSILNALPLPDGPAVPEGREPASAVSEPSEEELLALVPQGSESDFYLPQGLPSNWVDGDFIAPPEAVVAFARAVLARFGHHFPYATKMVYDAYQMGRRDASADSQQAAEAAEDEVVDEVRYVVYELRDQANDLSPSSELFGLIHNAADLLEQRHPAPVPVSERLPGPEDCDAEGRCWFLSFPFEYNRMIWSLEDRTYGCNTGFTHWLSYPSLPLPDQE